MGTEPLNAKIDRWRSRAIRLYEYVTVGVWRDTRHTFGVRLLKTLNLSVRSFMSADLQSTACALTYRTLLALVPALALIFAIGRGFGFQNLLQTQLFNYFPSQQKALETAFSFVDSYLAQASEGVFVGVGAVVLLWTLVSLVGAVEDSFNKVWGIKHGRTIWRKVTDYLAIFLILPIFMVCGSGLTVFLTSTVQDMLPFMTPLLTVLLDVASVVMIWLFFTGVYMLVPNTRVKFKNALPAGILSGIAFQVLQALFVSGQLYVSKYNAIYGGFAFLPLLLLWMQLVWLFTLSGALICYSAQNVSFFAFSTDVNSISVNYRRRIAVALMAVVAKRYHVGMKPLRAAQMEQCFGVPPRLVAALLVEMEEVGLLNRVVLGGHEQLYAYQPAIDPDDLTVGIVLAKLQNRGASGFIPGFAERFAAVNANMDSIEAVELTDGSTRLLDLDIKDLGPQSKESNQLFN